MPTNAKLTMANNKAVVGSEDATPTPAAISAALNSNLALQSELKSRLVDVRKSPTYILVRRVIHFIDRRNSSLAR